MSNWQLPEGIDELTGDQANAFESARRDLLDLYQSWGYEIVVPPMIEYADNLVLPGEGQGEAILVTGIFIPCEDKFIIL